MCNTAKDYVKQFKNTLHISNDQLILKQTLSNLKYINVEHFIPQMVN
jgi:hypothetical protein